MPTATSTFSLNVSAIKALCSGTTILNGTVVPDNGLGNIGDFYIDTTTYIFYGPKNDTTFWQTSAYLQVPVAVDTTSYSQVSSFFFQPNAGYFSASALNIGNTDQTGLIIDSVGYPCATFTTTGNTIATFTSNSQVLLMIDSTGITMSANTVNIQGPVTIDEGANIYSDILTVGASFEASGSKVVVGGINYISDPTFNYSVGIIGGRTVIAAAPQLDIFDGTAPASMVAWTNSTNKTRVGFNINTTDITNVSALSANVTVNGSLSTLSSFSTRVYDSLGKQLLQSRQLPGFSNLNGGSTTANIVTQVNLIISALTAHGLAI